MLSFLRKSLWVFPLVLCLVGLAIRILLLWGNTIPYMFDHARDSVEILRFLQTGTPLLIGPRSSIDGLFFGPGWYYLTAPFYWLSAGHPISPVGAVLMLFVIEVFLANKYFGKWPAIIMTFTPGWWWIATSAWNPFPLAFISLLLLIILKRTQGAQKLTLRHAALLGFITGMGFHFSTAYSMFYPVILAICLWRQNIKWNFKQFFLFSFFFVMTWLPQVAFEFRHEFLQTKAVLAYISGPSLTEFSIERILQTIGSISSSLFYATLPGTSVDKTVLIKLVAMIGIVSFFLFLHLKFKKSLVKKNMLFESWMFILVPSFAYLFLHFSVWYVIGMYPAAAIIVAHYFSAFHKKIQLALFILYVAAALFFLGKYWHEGRELFLTGRNFLPVKLQAVKTVRELAYGQPFSSYQFVPDVYDYTYQYLYFWQAQHGWPLPVEFSYAPNQPLYYAQKPELLESFKGDVPLPGTKPKYIFFIVEKPEYQNVLDEWWMRQPPHKIIKEVKISPELTVYQAVAE